MNGNMYMLCVYRSSFTISSCSTKHLGQRAIHFLHPLKHFVSPPIFSLSKSFPLLFIEFFKPFSLPRFFQSCCGGHAFSTLIHMLFLRNFSPALSLLLFLTPSRFLAFIQSFAYSHISQNFRDSFLYCELSRLYPFTLFKHVFQVCIESRTLSEHP